LGFALSVMAGLLAVVCGGSEGPPAGPTSSGGRLEVVTSIGILADLARNVGGNLVEVHSIVSPGVDVHSFQSKPTDSIAISKAAVIVSNGRGLDAFLDTLLQNTKRADAIHVVASDGLEGAPVEELEFPGAREEAGREEEPEHPEGDPHHWQDPLQAIHYVEQIRDGLALADAANASVYHANAAAYIQRLRALDLEIARDLSQVPIHRRHLVTFHDAFGYFARRYGWRVSAFVPGDASDVTPKSIVEVIEVVKSDGIPAIFTEPQFLPDLVEQAAQGAGAKVGTVYSDSLDSKAPTYIDMMRFNAKSLAEHLR
jgi:ABC-type Zn uptake system ZnuABC Zn-binding protein ZnuA